MKKISVVGLGYVGLPLALLIAKKGYDVAGIDLDHAKVEKINHGQDPIGEAYIQDNIVDTRLKATTSSKPIAESDIVIVCVPTPIKNGGHPDLAPLKGAVTMLAQSLRSGSLVIIESTVNPGVCDDVIIPLIESTAHLMINKDFWVSHCPERINPGDHRWNVENIPRVVGSSDDVGLRLTAEFYESIIDAPVRPMGTLKEAEAVKIVENSFRDINIAFVNELAMSFTKLGININHVIEGAATKPFGFLPHFPGVGVGGHCIPVDPYYLIEYARGYGFEHEFMSLARTINNRMPEFTVDRLIEGLNEVRIPIKHALITVLGISYKSNVADDRESPAYKVIKILKAKGARVETYDPYFPDKSTADSLEKAIKDKDAVVIATRHDEFQELPKLPINAKVLVDGKNMFNRDDISRLGIVYKGLGT